MDQHHQQQQHHDRQHQQQLHFLIVTFPVQGHLNPGRHLARRLARISGARITFCTPISAHRRLFPSLPTPESEFCDGTITYIPFSDGDDLGSNPRGFNLYNTQLSLNGSQHLAAILRRLSAAGSPVTCLIYTLLLPWAGRIAREFSIPSAQFWIQPATVLSIIHHFFHRRQFQSLIAEHSNNPSFPINIPNLPPLLQIRDLPTFLTINDPESPNFIFISAFRETIEAMKSGERVLVNTFDGLEPDAVGSLADSVNLMTIGPVMPEDPDVDPSPATRDLLSEDRSRYMEWLEKQEEGSVIYVSFGSNVVLKKGEVDEIRRGLKGSGRPYLWAIRSEEMEGEGEIGGEEGMEIRWCDQVGVLGHRAVGCFVTHCGWNSTAEGLVKGVPMVAVARWADQATNAWMVEKVWGTGVRVVAALEEGVVAAEEVRRCVEIVMGEGERGKEIRRAAAVWKETARAAVERGGSSDRNLRAFVDGFSR